MLLALRQLKQQGQQETTFDSRSREDTVGFTTTETTETTQTT